MSNPALEKLLAKARAHLESAKATEVSIPTPTTPTILEVKPRTQDDLLIEIFQSSGMEANEEQIEFIKGAMKGENIILSGAAGTGKTTPQAMMIHALQATGNIGQLKEDTKWLRQGTAGAVIVSFTNKAVNNIRSKMPEDLRHNCHTIHKLLEFSPEWFEIDDDEAPGGVRKTMRFTPKRDEYNPLPRSLSKIIIEEASMVDISLYEKLLAACPHNPQIILLGDINQLPPFEGESILGKALAHWPVIELKKIYRQALESPIISFAWKIKNGEALDPKTVPDGKRIKVPSFEAMHVPNQLTIRPWQKRLDELAATITATQFFNSLYDNNLYNPDEDIILIPFNKGFGSVELNNGISQHLGKKRNAVVHEVIAGFKKHYLAIGDKVMYAKEDAYIIDIARNPSYFGKSPQSPSPNLDRWGYLREDGDTTVKAIIEEQMDSGDDIDAMLDAVVAGSGEDRVNQCSHIITVRMCFDDREIELQTAGDVNNVIGGYAITVHKSQGSEWDRVFVCLHHRHAAQLSRELLYTAVTRAKKELFIICEPNSFEKGVKTQRIPGNTLEEKLEFIKKKEKEKEVKKQLELKLAGQVEQQRKF